MNQLDLDNVSKQNFQEADLFEMKPAAPPMGLSEKIGAIFDQLPHAENFERESISSGGFQNKIREWTSPLLSVAAVAAIFLASVFILKVSGVFERDNEAPYTDGGPQKASIDPNLGKLQPVAAENEIQAVTQGQIIIGNNGQYYREYHLQVEEQMIWRNPDDGAEVRVFLPRERIVRRPIPVN